MNWRFNHNGVFGVRSTCVALLAVLAACAPVEPPKQEPPVSSSVPAPTPNDVSVRITAAQDGRNVEVALNQRFAVELVGVPTAGYIWAPARLPPFVSRAGEAGGPTTQAQNQPGFAGGNHWEVLMFVATTPGSGELVLEQRRPWETSEPPTAVFRVTIVAR